MAGGAIAYAQVPSTDGTITGCYMKSGGAIRIIDAPSQKCKSGETQLTWNQHGNPGTNGTDGNDGTNGVSGFVSMHEDSELGNATSAIGSHLVTCPAGPKVLGGGARFINVAGQTISSDSAHLSITQSSPNANSNGWFVTFDASSLDVLDVTAVRVSAQCVAVTP
jgi:hypothetical protein